MNFPVFSNVSLFINVVFLMTFQCISKMLMLTQEKKSGGNQESETITSVLRLPYIGLLAHVRKIIKWVVPLVLAMYQIYPLQPGNDANKIAHFNNYSTFYISQKPST